MKDRDSTDSDRSEIKSIDMKLMASFVVFSTLFLAMVYGLSANPDVRSVYEAAVVACQC